MDKTTADSTPCNHTLSAKGFAIGKVGLKELRTKPQQTAHPAITLCHSLSSTTSTLYKEFLTKYIWFTPNIQQYTDLTWKIELKSSNTWYGFPRLTTILKYPTTENFLSCRQDTGRDHS
jgi:hypothetical protein